MIITGTDTSKVWGHLGSVETKLVEWEGLECRAQLRAGRHWEEPGE